MSTLHSPIITARASVVRAAAGTGKTRLLTTRLIHLLFEGVEPGAILAITFTRKAAAEIYRRVVARLLDMVTANEEALALELKELDIPVEPHNLRRARTLFERLLTAEHELRATTFHAFCQEILRRFPLEAGVPPGFELLDSTAELERAAWFALERDVHSHPQSALAQATDVLLQTCGVEGTRQALERFLGHRSDWWAYTEGQPDSVASAEARLERTLRLDVVATPEPFAPASLSRYRELRRRAARLGDEDAALLERAALVPPAEMLDVATPLLLRKDGAMRALKRSRAMCERLGENDTNELLALHERLARCAQQRHEARRREQTARISKAWYRCGARLLEHYQRLKAEEGLLDFADLEWLTYRLLNRSQHAEWVQYKLDQRIDHLLVDEFQDTNPTQWRLLLPLLREMASADTRRRSVFLVGDEKQSIYRFRRADPGLFNTAQDWLGKNMQARSFAQDESWRASAALIEFVNLVYDGPAETGGNGTEFLLENFRRHKTRHPARWGRVELLPIIHRELPVVRTKGALSLRDPLRQPRPVDEDQRYHAEGELVARKIIELIGKPIDDKGLRPLAYDDVMILLRDRAHATAYEAALRRAGIPYVGTGRGTFMESLEIQDLIHLLRTLSTPYDDLALASALRSPLFACEHEDLMRLVNSDAGRTWSERLATIAGELAPDHTLVRAARLLKGWAQRADRIPVHDLLDQIYQEGNVVARYISAAPAHLQTRVQVNLRRLLELALEVDGGRYPSLSRFLTRVPLLADEERAASAQASGGGYVRIMTIHAAKGLECPVVFLVDAMRDYRRHAMALRALVDWPVEADRPKHVQLIGHGCGRDRLSTSLLHSQTRGDVREEANLLYVAITRAKHALFISGCEPGKGAEHSWYHFLEQRVRRAAAQRPEGIAGLQLPNEASPGGGLVLESGNPVGALETGKESAVVAAVDPGLSQPIVLSPAPTLVYPSRGVGMAKPSEGPGPVLYPEAAATRGVAIHRMLQLLGSGLERPTARRRALYEFDHRLRPEDLDGCWDEACAVFDEPALRHYFDPQYYRRAHNELAILYSEAGLSVYGVVDRAVEQDQGIVLLDYKTHRHATPTNAHDLAQAYAEQMRLYAQGARRLWPDSEIRAFVLFTGPRCLVDMTGEFS